jgi:FAD/FMN-containing dehydrogenase
MAIGSQTIGTPELDAEALKELESDLRGDVLRPSHPGYEAARTVFNAMVDRHPALIVRCKAVPDVQRALEFARVHNLLVAVRGGGHNVAGKALCDNGMVIDLSAMKEMRVDPAARTVQAEAGLTWGEFDRETQPHGLATTGGFVSTTGIAGLTLGGGLGWLMRKHGGFVSTTGIAGLTLGGGLGWLMRKHGLASDNLQSVQIVTADGQLRNASASENPDLFWAVRGGGGNFGIVTSFEYQLHPVGQMLAGIVFFPFDQAGAVLRFYRDLMATAPDELMAYAVLLTSPEGVRMLALPVCYVGPMASAEEALRPIRSFGQPAADLVRPMGYLEVQSMFDAGFPAGRLNYWKSNFLRDLSDQAIDIMVRFFAAVPSSLSAVAIEPLRGVVGRVAVEQTAFPHREALFSLVIVSMWTDAAASDANTRWTREFWSAMQPFTSDAVYVNYLDADDADRVQAAYNPETYQRLRLLKQRYDPQNVFRVNQNIGPTT